MLHKHRRAIGTLIFTTLAFFALTLVDFSFSDEADARSRSGGRSFGSGGAFSKPAPSRAPAQPGIAPSSRPGTPGFGSGGSFMRGLGGGLLGGFLGSMLFGGMAHGMGMGGFGGSGFGLFEILLIGGLIFFFYKRFAKPKTASNVSSGAFFQRETADSEYANPSGSRENLRPQSGGPAYDTLNYVRIAEPEFDPELFKEIAQDVFFKVQAAWTRRDIDSIRGLLGDQLRGEYEGHFAELRAKGHINRLENISVRKVEILDSGAENGEVFMTVGFTANLLDYTVEEKNDNVVEGDPHTPVKFQERWTFARPVDSTAWRLEGIE